MSMARNTMTTPGWMALSGIPGLSQVSVKQKDITVPDIPLETDAGTEAIQFIVQRLYTGWQDANRISVWLGPQPMFNPSMFTSVFPPMMKRMHRWKQRWSCLSLWLRSKLVFVPSTFSLMFTPIFTFENLNRPGSRVVRRTFHKAINWLFPYLKKKSWEHKFGQT